MPNGWLRISGGGDVDLSTAIGWITLLGVALALAMDALAVSIAAGLTVARVTPRRTFRIAFHFGLFQFLMPVLGFSFGAQFAEHIKAYDHWIAFVLLGFVGGKMIYESFRGEEAPTTADPTRGLLLVTLSIAVSIDALAVGLSMAMLGVSVWTPAVVIGLVAAALSALGIVFGSRLGERVGVWAERAGGCVLLLIGARILISHLAAG